MDNARCPHCDGCGQVEIIIDRIEWYEITDEIPCPNCNGLGSITLIRNANGEWVGNISNVY